MFSSKKILFSNKSPAIVNTTTTTIAPIPNVLTITQHPQNTTAADGEASFSVTATVSDGSQLSYQWEVGRITDGGETWTQQSLTHPGPWSSIAYGNNNFVAVCPQSQISTTSQDGIRWTHHSMPSGSSWHKIAYGNGTFVTFPFYTTVQSDGHKGALATSPDGITWTKRDLPSGGIGERFYWRSITHGNERFVAVSTIIGVQETAAVSLNGITWSYSRMPETNGYRVTYGDGKFVAIGYNSNVAATSVDGFNWTKRTLPVSAWWDTITYGNGTFVAYGGTGLSYSYILTSTDGVAWMQHLIPDMYNMKSLMYGNGVFVLVGENSVAFTSRDGASWTQHPMPSVSLGYSAVTYGGGKFVAIGSGTSAVATSDSDTLQFFPISGETSATLNLTGLTTADDGERYRVVVDSPSVEPITSNSATLTVT